MEQLIIWKDENGLFSQKELEIVNMDDDEMSNLCDKSGEEMVCVLPTEWIKAVLK